LGERLAQQGPHLIGELMENESVGMAQQGRAERDKFENELKRIVKASDEAGIILRVIGSLAFQLHCPKFGYLQEAMGRAYTDLDFAAYGRQTTAIRALMAGLGYRTTRRFSRFRRRARDSTGRDRIAHRHLL
jgi:hypothetical protein